MFRSVDETDKFSFEDCVLNDIEKAEDGLIFNVEALIVKANNSQNTNFTDSYAAQTQIKAVNASVTDLIKCGYRYYNADGELVKSVPDEAIVKPEWASLIESFFGNYLVEFTKTDAGYEIEIEMQEEDGMQGNSYLLVLSASSIIVTWERYLNRVQR